MIACGLAVVAGTAYLFRVCDGPPWTYGARLAQFQALRVDAQSLEVGMPLTKVTATLGVPDHEEGWLSHLPTCRVYYFDISREVRSGRKPVSYISVLVDSESGVKTVDVYDPVFETCSGHKIESTCTPINRRHHDRFAGPVIIGA
jgi:hypothetical protein